MVPCISVIVPVYNAERWLRRCIDSILAQTFTDFELLLIDDGSTDGSGLICDEYAKRDPRVRVFHKPNGGVSSARRIGLENAGGQWIGFVDADDYIDSDTIESMFECIKPDCDIIVFEHNLNAELGKEQYAEKLFNFSWWPIWGKLFKRGILNPEIIDIPKDYVVGEDFFVNLKSIKNLNGKVVCKAIKKYHYNIDNPGSANKIFQRTYEYELSMIKEARTIVHTYPFFPDIENAYFRWLIMYLSGFMGLRYKIDYSEAWIKELSDISHRIELTRFDKLVLKAIEKPVYRLIFVIDKQCKRIARKILVKCKLIR